MKLVGPSKKTERLIGRSGCKPVERMNVVGGSASATPCSSYHPSPSASYNPSPCASYNPSPGPSSFPSPATSYLTNPNVNANDGNSIIPWLKNLSSTSSSASAKLAHHLYMLNGSVSAPVTPPLSSPTARSPRIKTNWDDPTAMPSWAGQRYSFLTSSTPPSPRRQILPDSGWLSGLRIPTGGSTSPTYSLVSSKPLGMKEIASAPGSRMWTPGQSGTCSPAIAGAMDQTSDVPMDDSFADEFAFGVNQTGLVKAWEGERIHEECVTEDLELTLGNSGTR
ncbi:hypothetical protein Scep_011762 [Stephania cephalantha]|uniref:Protein BZR1 homolog n=1 Tax=Stephania cephalantha TaxID=152367 RepID=A0AAP0P6U9_9MAGN